MCRLFGYVASSPASVVELLGRDAFDAFTALTAVHGDGWGMAWRGGTSRVVRTIKSTRPAADDPQYAELAEEALGAAGILHLRWATSGLSVTDANSHPFAEDGYALAHNGNIWPRDQLEALLSSESLAMLVGDTDSERYFRFVLQCIGESQDEIAGLSRAVGVLHDEFPHCSLNALLLTPNRLFAVHVNSDAATPTRALNEIFVADHLEPFIGHETEYFAMSYRVTADAVFVISSGLDEAGWSAMAPDTVVTIDLATRETTRLPT